jgi:hypothetical protein
VTETAIRSAVISDAAKLQFRDPSDALPFIDKSKIKLHDDGTVEGLDEQLKAIAKSKPYLLATTLMGAQSPSNPGNGAEQGETRQQKLARKTEVANAYTKTQALMDKAYNPKEGVIALASKIKALSADQKESITGYSGYIPSFRASSREADTLIGNLKGVVTGLGKDAAAASGAIGPMAVQEWKIVADMIAKLDLEGMTPRALDAQMNRIIEQVRNATNLAERVYNVQYGDDIKEYPDFKLRGAPSPRAKTPVTKTPPGVSAAEWKAMTPAERKLWQ